jgi:dipeptidase
VASREKRPLGVKFLSKMNNNHTVQNYSRSVKKQISLKTEPRKKNSIKEDTSVVKSKRFEHQAANIRKSRSISKFLKPNQKEKSTKKQIIMIASKHKSPLINSRHRNHSDRFESSNFKTSKQKPRISDKNHRPKLYLKTGKNESHFGNRVGPKVSLQRVAHANSRYHTASNINDISDNIARLNMQKNQFRVKFFPNQYKPKSKPTNYSQKTFNFNNKS